MKLRRILINGRYLYQDGRLLRIRNLEGPPSDSFKSVFTNNEIRQIIAALNKTNSNYELNLEEIGNSERRFDDGY